MKITHFKPPHPRIRIDAGKAGVIEADNILIRAWARILVREAKERGNQITENDFDDRRELTFDHPLDEVRTLET